MARTNLQRVTADAREVSRRLARAEDSGDWRAAAMYARELDTLIDKGQRLKTAADT